MAAAQRADNVRDETHRQESDNENDASEQTPLENQIGKINQRRSADCRRNRKPQSAHSFAAVKQCPSREHDERERKWVMRGISDDVEEMLAAGDQHDRAQPEQVLTAR